MAIRAAVNGYTLLPISLLRQLRTDDITTQQLENKTALLTQKELEILESVSKGSSNKQIADELYMSSRAVEYNLTKSSKIKSRITLRSFNRSNETRHFESTHIK